MTTEVLHDLPGRDASKAGELAAVAGRIDADPEQTGGGVRATLTMANAGDTPVQMLNPYDLPQWQLLGDGGAPLQLPERRSNLRTRQPSDGEWKLDSAVRIVEVRRNGEPSDAAELDAATLALAAGDELGVTYELDRIVQGGRACSAGKRGVPHRLPRDADRRARQAALAHRALQTARRPVRARLVLLGVDCLTERNRRTR